MNKKDNIENKNAVSASRRVICYTSARPLTFGSLFSGIGGMDLGLERAGFNCEWQVEINEYARKVLNKHWKDVPKYNDIRECGKHNLKSVDIIAGGFPCQDLSIAGKRVGIDGERSGLWREFHRIICELRPEYVIIENVTGLLVSGIERVLANLSESGYDAEWQVLSAAAFGAIHQRERVFIVAYPNGERCRNTSERYPKIPIFTGKPSQVAWEGYYESLLCRVDDGLPNYVDRLRGIGNAVVPQIAEWIGNAIRQTIEDV